MKRLILIIIFILALVVALTAVILSRTGGSSSVFNLYKYDNASRYTAGSGSVDASKVREVLVDWVSGSVDIVEGDVPGIRFDESSKATLDAKTCMYWYLDGSTLRIKWCRSGLSRSSFKSSKNLTIVVPRGILFDDITVNTVSSETRVVADAQNCRINSVSGPILIDGSYADTVKVDNVSGAVDLRYRVCPKNVSVETVSGSIAIAIPAQSGFTATLKSVSGKFSCDIPTTAKDGKYVAGDGKSTIRVESVSGSVKVQTI